MGADPGKILRKPDGRFAGYSGGSTPPTAVNQTPPPLPPSTRGASKTFPTAAPSELYRHYQKVGGEASQSQVEEEMGEESQYFQEFASELYPDFNYQVDESGRVFTAENCTVTLSVPPGETSSVYTVVDGRDGGQVARFDSYEDAVPAMWAVSKGGRDAWPLVKEFETLSGASYEIAPDGSGGYTMGVDDVTVRWAPNLSYSVEVWEQTYGGDSWQPAEYVEVHLVSTADPKAAAEAASIASEGGADAYFEHVRRRPAR